MAWILFYFLMRVLPNLMLGFVAFFSVLFFSWLNFFFCAGDGLEFMVGIDFLKCDFEMGALLRVICLDGM